MALAPGTRLGPYEILSPLGAGGMGEVYRARDLKLKREVAIKVLPEALARDEAALARFESEALAVAALSHPSILSIHDFGAEGGISYAVMELLEGETLRQRLDAGPIPVRQAIDLALQIARGLVAAHERGVVHRDLKPENLVVSPDGHVKILDFGLAKRLEPQVSSGSETSAPTVSGHTAPRALMGTMGYMSPEQIRGQDVDARSDLFSFGAVLYEMLTGRRAFRGDSGADTMAAILMLEPPDMMLSGRAIPSTLDQVVRRCLAKLPEGRYATARELVAELKDAARTFASGTVSLIKPKEAEAAPGRRLPRALPLLAAGAVVAGTVGLLLLLVSRDAPPPPARGPVRIAVLPFENLGAPEDEYFADGIADEVRGKLTSLPGLEVIARGSSVPYRKTGKTPVVIARELKVRYILTATVRWERGAGAGRVHVAPELVEVTGDGAAASRWQATFEGELTGVFRVQADIAARVAGALGMALGAVAEARLNERPTKNVAAYDAFLRGEAAASSLGATDPASLRKAIALYEDAVGLDPTFALAWARLSRALVHLYTNSVPSPELLERSRQAAARAVELAPGRPEGYLAQGSYEGLVRGDFARELELLEKGQRLGLASAEVLTAAALAEQSAGRWHDTLNHLLQAERLDPRSVLTKRRLALAYLLLRRYREARGAIEQGLAIAPGSLALLEQRVMVCLLEGEVAGAKAALAEAARMVDEKALIAHLVNYQHLEWLLDEDQRRLLLDLSPAAFDGDRGAWGLHLGLALRPPAGAPDKGLDRARAYAEEARRAFEDQLRNAPDQAERVALLGLSLACLGRKEEAIRAGERAIELVPVAADAYRGPLIQHQLVRIYLMAGETEKALDRLEPLLKVPYTLSAAWLRIDPTFAPLRGHPRFENLAAVTP